MTQANVAAAPVLDEAAVRNAEATCDRALGEVLSGGAGPRGVVVTAPAGAGKSHLIATGVDRARAACLRVAVAAPTNEQAFGLVRAVAHLHCSRGAGRSVAFVPASDRTL